MVEESGHPNLTRNNKRSTSLYLVGLLLNRYKAVSFFPGISGTLGYVFQLSAIAILFASLSGGGIKYLSIALPGVPDSPRAMQVLVLILLVTSAAMTYLQQYLAYRLGSNLEGFLIKHFANYLESPYLVRFPKTIEVSDKNSLLKTILSDSKSTNRAAQMLLLLPGPILSLVATTIFLMYIDWKVTLALGPGFLALALFMRKLGHYSQINNDRLEDFSKQIRADLNKLATGEPLARHNYEQNAVNYTTSYRQTVSMPALSTLVNELFIAFFLGGIVFYFQRTSTSAAEVLPNVILYIVGLRFLASFAKQASARLTILRRFKGQVGRLISFLEANPYILESHPGKSNEKSFDQFLIHYVGKEKLKKLNGYYSVEFVERHLQMSLNRAKVLSLGDNIKGHFNGLPISSPPSSLRSFLDQFEYDLLVIDGDLLKSQSIEPSDLIALLGKRSAIVWTSNPDGQINTISTESQYGPMWQTVYSS